MAKHTPGMTVTRLLGWLLCSSLSSAMLVPDPRGNPPPMGPQYPPDPDNSTGDPDPFPYLPNVPPEMSPYPMAARGMPMAPPDLPHPGPPMLTGMMNTNASDLSRTTGFLGVNPNGGAPPDMTYCEMLLDAPVPPPISQVPWFCVCSRCKTNVGLKGDRGDRGLPGIPGSPGIRGLTGMRGRPGFVGSQGVKGQKGDDAEKGAIGPVGSTGPKGDRGFKGEKGDQGEQGLSGGQGPPGETGTCPEACSRATGPVGQPGLPGSAGARGLPGLNGTKGGTGPKGDTGEMGRPGAPGADGMKGDLGLKGECNCSNGAKGEAGQQGLAGPKGERGNAGPQGAAGVAGAKGDLGNTGMTGMPGPCSPAIMSSFSASLGTVYPTPNMPVPFTNVITNRQMHFNPMSGVYMAPINGTYVFNYHLVVFSKVLKVGLFLNYNPIVKTTESTGLAIASQQVVLHLGLGDRVWLQVKDGITNGMYADSESSSTFSGFLLYPDSCDMPLSRDFLLPVPPSEEAYTWGDLPEATPEPTTAP